MNKKIINFSIPMILFIYRFSKKVISFCERAVAYAQLSMFRSVGECSKISSPGTFIHPENIEVGSHVRIGRNNYYQAKGGILIGDYSHIARNVTIYSCNHNYNGDLLPYDHSYVLKKVVIGRYVWIGSNVNIVPGVTIGDGAIIGSGTTVSFDIPNHAIVVGVKAKIVKFRDPKKVDQLIRDQSYLKYN
jgi:acetyltransferase-like isoleucine patch superfamily enzyme